MPAALPIRSDRSPFALRRLACHADDGRVSARLLALANALEGIPREAAAHLAGMTGQTLGDWVHRYNAEGVAGLRDHHRAGRHCRLDEGQQAALKAIVLRGPDPKRDGCIAWRARDLCRLVEQRFRSATVRAGCSVSCSAWNSPGRSRGQSIPRRTAGRKSISKSLPGLMQGVAARHPEAERIELWFEDEARIGQKGRVTQVWYQRGHGRAACAITVSPRCSCSGRSVPSAVTVSPWCCPRPTRPP